MLLGKLVFGHANREGQKAFRAVEVTKGSLEDYTNACNDIGSPAYLANHLAAAFAKMKTLNDFPKMLGDIVYNILWELLRINYNFSLLFLRETQHAIVPGN